MGDAKVVSLEGLKIACSNCSLSSLCLPHGLPEDDIDRLETIVKRNRPYQRGALLYSPGDKFHSLYIVKTGAIKSYIQTESGDEHVIGFHLPGEILGLDAIKDNIHGCFSKALETTSVCEFPFSRLEELSTAIPGLQHQMLRLLSSEIGNDASMISLLGNSTAEERLASFLISMSERFKQRGFSATDFFLTMSRQDIGSYLGLALETVSRLFTRFQEEGILQVERKHVKALDTDRLRKILRHQSSCHPSKSKNA